MNQFNLIRPFLDGYTFSTILKPVHRHQQILLDCARGLTDAPRPQSSHWHIFGLQALCGGGWGGRVLEYQSGIMLTWVDVGKGVTFLWARKHRLFLPFSSFLSMIGYPDCHH